MERSVRGVMSRVCVGVMEGLLNCKNRNLQNSGVSQEGGHDAVPLLSHIILKNFQFLSHDSEEGERAMFEAVMMQTERGRRRERASD
jgi:hypothetical protein